MNCANIFKRCITGSRVIPLISNNKRTMTKRPDRYFSVSLPDKARYFKQVSLAESETESRNKVPGKLGDTFLVFPRSVSVEDQQKAYIKSALKAYNVYRKTSSWEGVSVSHCLQSSKGSDLTEVTSDILERGVCIQSDAVSEKETAQDTSARVLEMLKNDENLLAYNLVDLSEKAYKLVSLQEEEPTEDKEVYLVPVDGEIVVRDNKNMKSSPIFALPHLRPVFHSIKDVRHVLSHLIDLPEVKQLLDITDQHVTKEIMESCDKPLPQPFVVVEGMDATGKTTLTEALERKLGAARYFTPPPPITALRPFFDKFPEIVRRAYYCMGNYIVAGSIMEECQKRPVIMDRYWHSTTAYGIANESSTDDMPDVGHPVYQWPGDLLKPTLVLFLTVSEEIRKQRLSGRGIQATFEEKSLDKDQLFRQRLCTAYRRMQEPACVEIDASGTVDEVQTEAVNILSKYGINL